VRVLVTGAAGSIGQVLTVGLADRGHEVVAFDRVPAPDGSDVPWHTGDCADADAVAAVFAAQSAEGQPLDAVAHLAGIPDEASLPDSITSHTVTTAALLDAMVEHGARRFVYAGSNHAVGRTPRPRDALDGQSITVEHRPRPDTFYGVGKVAAEAVMSLYADRYGLDVVSCRIGSFLPQPTTVRHLSTWLSHDDCVRMFEASLTAPAPGYAVVYGISRNTRAWWDLAPGRALGYDPQDDAETFSSGIAARSADEVEGSYVGGQWATEAFFRPALDRS
jgi:uronate dehydrogenase